MTLFEEDIYKVEHEALQRIENVVWRLELDDKHLYRIAGYIAGIRAVGDKLVELIEKDRAEHHEALLAEVERKERLAEGENCTSDACGIEPKYL